MTCDEMPCIPCNECKEKYDMPYNFCCLEECNEHESCKYCTHGTNSLIWKEEMRIKKEEKDE